MSSRHSFSSDILTFVAIEGSLSILYHMELLLHKQPHLSRQAQTSSSFQYNQQPTTMAKKKSATRNAQPTKQSEAPLNNKSGPDRSFPQTLLNDKHTNRQGLHLEDLIPNAVFVARNALSSKECEDWIKYAENSGYDTVAHPATKWIAHRECSRLQKNDWTMAHRLFGRIQQVVAEASEALDIFDKSTRVNSSYANKSYQPITCNPNLRLYKYTKGQWFGKHIDGTNKIEWKGEDVPYAAKDVAETETEITVLFYLSSCKGGATRFH